MAENFGTDPQKMLDWDKKLGKQSEYVKKAIEPLLTLNFAYTKECIDIGDYYGNENYKNYFETKNEEDPNFVKQYISNFSVSDLYDYLAAYDDNEKTAVEKLKSIGIEGVRHGDKIDHVFNDEYIKSLDMDAYFEEQQRNTFDADQARHEYEMEEYFKELEKIETSEQSPVPDRNLETAQKIGYVQGVCESVLAMNTDENRKIMSEATITVLSKKLLSEMNVTKDMAQKFANPETYRALEQCVFAPKQEQQLEQQQSHSHKI